ncbi:copper chaperone [Tumebacillus sp. BK434]|uniref:copper ion binding protein n=1 Tax=Tumebacillus sp. BK434 TaxID=2512169 RepID=UPI00104D1349|nr:copper ion binding protein [Tumebacillus sp. BK434]TCP59554.1 copper chaperone [Tumebacillus sp. BK434]
MTSFTFNVKGMSCGHCKSAVEGALKEAGAAAVDVDLEAGRVAVSYDADKYDLNKLRDAIEDAGYDVV